MCLYESCAWHVCFYKLNINIHSFFFIAADKCFSKKSAQSSEKTEDVNENADDDIGPVLQVCCLLSLLIALYLTSFFDPFQEVLKQRGC